MTFQARPAYLFVLSTCLCTIALFAQAQKADSPPTAVGVERVDLPGIDNAFRLSPRLYSGADPAGEDALKALKALGVRTIISVDGATPNVEAARKLGLRYIHLPIGYDGVPSEQAPRIIKAAQAGPGSVFIHCHHGTLRGPAAAAVCGRALEGWTPDEAVAWLKRAGAAPEYRGLHASVRDLVLPTAEALARIDAAALPERSRGNAMVESMLQVDRRFDQMKLLQKSGFTVTPDHPDLDPPHEALLLAEQFRELRRLPETKARGQDFLNAAEAARRHADDLESALRAFVQDRTPEARSRADRAFRAVGASCASCHAAYRNNP